VYNSVALPTTNGLDVTWDSYQFNGTGADGISFDLASVNPNNPAPPSTVGPSGGSLGYSSATGVPGVPFGYLGFGADVFGNFESASFGGTGCGQSTSAIAESMGVRGPGNGTAGYCLLGQSNLSAGTTLDSRIATSRGSGASSIAVPEEVVINPSASPITATSSGVTVPGGDWMFATEPLVAGAPGTQWVSLLGALPTNPVGVPSSWLNTSTGLPLELAFGWASSTGGSNEIHQINFLQASSLTTSPSLALTNTDSGGGTLPANSSVTVTLTPSVPLSSAINESQTVVASDTLPASLTPASASGTNWSCSTAGQLVSCAYQGATPITPGTTLPAIAITATTSSTPGSFTNTASVSSPDAAPATTADHGTIVPAAQVITFTNTPPVSPLVGSTYTVSATGGASGNAVTFSVDGATTSGCTVNASTGLVTLSAPAGTCVIDANQVGNTTYAAATQVHQSVTTILAPTATISSPSSGGTYVVGQKITTAYTCTDGANGPGLVSCSDGTSHTGVGTLMTSSAGTFTYTVTATSKDGQTATSSIHYKVVANVVAHAASLVVYFSNNSWVLSAHTIAQLNQFASTLKRDHLTNVVVSGYASSTGSLANNRLLGTERAKAVWSYLSTRLHVLGVRGLTGNVHGYGGSRYDVRPYTAAGNRRTVIVAQ
jgi:outer membrane protein OmpA-like peptidoglycan-associated protein